MKKEFPRPGDTIEIIYKDEHLFGKLFTVIQCPTEEEEECKQSNLVWIKYNGCVCCVYASWCKIITRSNISTHFDNNVDQFLDKQRDDNLRSVFG